MTRTGRPSGSYGPAAQALLDAARSSPGTVRDLAARGMVGLGVARVTASRLAARGELIVLDGGVRPAILAAPGSPAAPAVCLGVCESLDLLARALYAPVHDSVVGDM